MYYASPLFVETPAFLTRVESTVIFSVSYLHVSFGDLRDFADAAFRERRRSSRRIRLSRNGLLPEDAIDERDGAVKSTRNVTDVYILRNVNYCSRMSCTRTNAFIVLCTHVCTYIYLCIIFINISQKSWVMLCSYLLKLFINVYILWRTLWYSLWEILFSRAEDRLLRRPERQKADSSRTKNTRVASRLLWRPDDQKRIKATWLVCDI